MFMIKPHVNFILGKYTEAHFNPPGVKTEIFKET